MADRGLLLRILVHREGQSRGISMAHDVERLAITMTRLVVTFIMPCEGGLGFAQAERVSA